MNEKLTAYALNELAPDERAAFEAQMVKEPALRHQAEEMKKFCSLLNEQIARDGNVALMPEQRSKLMENFHSAPKIIRPFWRRPGFVSSIGLAAAACVATMLTLHHFNQPEISPDFIAQTDKKPGEPVNANRYYALDIDSDAPAAKNPADRAFTGSLPKVAPPPLPSDRISSDAPPNTVLFSSGNADLSGASGLAASRTISPDKDWFADEKSRNRQVDGTIAMNAPAAISLYADHRENQAGGKLSYGQANGSADATTINGGMLQMSPAGGTVAIANQTEARRFGAGDTAGLKRGTESPTALASPLPESDLKAKTVASLAPGRPDTAAKAARSPAAESKLDAEVADHERNFFKSKDNPTTPPATSSPVAAPQPAVVASSGTVTGLNTYTGSTSNLGDKGNDLGILNKKSLADAPAKEEVAKGMGRGGSLGYGGGGGGENGLDKNGSGTLALRANNESSTAEKLTENGRFDETSRDVAERGERSAGWQIKPPGTQTYRPIVENPFLYVAQQPLSTFSLDVDTASYANVRRMLNAHQRPPADAVRLEELINYFPYSYDSPTDDKPFAVHVDIAEAPWQPLHRLARVAVKGREIKGERQPANFVFLLDVSGSMQPDERLPLIKKSLLLLVEQLHADDRVAIVTYAGESGVALPATSGSEKEKITQAIEHLSAGGSTNGAGGIRLAYEQAALNFSKERINRVILATDGDFNVGTSNVQELEKLIAEKAKSGVFLSVLGVGTDNLHDHTMQAIADRGNGNYHYLDSVGEARKVLVEQMTGTLVTIAKDVKVQIEFNPAQVAAYRLIGYEKRLLAKEDFNNDKKDAGEIGAGHTITALYEIVPASLKYPDGKPVVDDLKYAANKLEKTNAPGSPASDESTVQSKIRSTETMTVKLRYKLPDGDKSQLMEIPFTDNEKKLAASDKEFQFAVSVAGFGMLLRDSQHAGELTWDMVRQLALNGKGPDEQGWRGEFIQLIEKARGLGEAR